MCHPRCYVKKKQKKKALSPSSSIASGLLSIKPPYVVSGETSVVGVRSNGSKVRTATGSVGTVTALVIGDMPDNEASTIDWTPVLRIWPPPQRVGPLK
jgi:hypothetical protein